MIINKPIITEKSMQNATNGKYSFKVSKSANKHQIAKEIEKVYKVKVDKVNIMIQKPETKIIKGKYASTIKSWKKAMITLKKGQKLEGYEVKE
ncbi:MAG: 50S ribosomal protein L23 [Candidatus Berkelbacteria bacterium]|nr:50S ribosomal protein L23 [Candidatus Berkelbacteria bacterium]